MTFSDKTVADYVNANFVSAWFNRGPGFTNDDYRTEQWIFTSSMEAYPTKNICTFFMTPEAKVFYYAAGYYSPDVFMELLRTATALREALFDDRLRVKAGGLDDARKIHERAAWTMESSRKKMLAAQGKKDGGKSAILEYNTYSYRGLKHRHEPVCLTSLCQGFEYLGKLHRHWSETEDLPGLQDVQYGYLWGNPFTEESANAKGVKDKTAEAAKEDTEPRQPKIEDEVSGGRRAPVTVPRGKVVIFGQGIGIEIDR